MAILGDKGILPPVIQPRTTGEKELGDKGLERKDSENKDWGNWEKGMHPKRQRTRGGIMGRGGNHVEDAYKNMSGEYSDK